MARKRARPMAAAPETVTAKRASRLYRLLKLLAAGPQKRSVLTRRLGLDVRGFYRDLVVLRDCGIDLTLDTGRYALRMKFADGVDLLPFPDPHLTLAEASALAKGRGPAHRKLKKQIDQIVK